MPPSRREFLAQALGAAAVPLLPACRDGSAPPGVVGEPALAPSPQPPPAPSPTPSAPPPPTSNAAVFPHGVASGDPLADRVILWTRVTAAHTATSATLTWRLYADAALTQPVREGSVSTTAMRDWTVKVDADGLAPGTTYYYRFEATSGASGLSPIGRTRTLPARAAHLRVALATCSVTGSVMNAYARIAERADLDLVLHLGDYAYCDADFTLDQYRRQHQGYKADNAELRELHRQHPMVVIWDDHETTNDAHETGAPPPNPAIGPLWPLRRDAATQAFFEYLPIRDNPDGSRRIYRRFDLGGLMELFMLDGRLEGRSEQVNGQNDAARNDPARTMLGEAQEQWLYDGLRGSTARWKLIGNQTMLGHLNEVTATGALTNNWMDQWDGYPPARQRLYDVLKGSSTQPAVSNVVVCTGDWHNSFIMDLPQDPKAGYDGATGAGSLAVEYVTPSITSGFFDVSDLSIHSPHIKHHNDAAHGYQLLDIQPDRVIGEEWQVDTAETVSTVQTLAVAFETVSGSNCLKPHTTGATAAKPSAPALAPAA